MINNPVFGQLLMQEPDIVKESQKFIHQFYDQKFEESYAMFDEVVKNQITSGQLKTAYDATRERFGELKSIGPTSINTSGNYTISLTKLIHENGDFNIQLTFNEAGKVAGFFFKPIKEDVEPAPVPTYADPSKFYEKDVKFGMEPFILDGKLTVPKNVINPPVLILVHGSGPNDMNEQVGPNMPFRDLAVGLASNGVAVLRYNKRTFQYNSAMAEIRNVITLEQETIEDVGFAIEYIRTLKDIDTNRVFVLGHSLGGLAIPQIAKEYKYAHGFIIMAGANQPLEDKILSQYKYISKLPKNQGINEETLAELEKQVKKIKEANFGDENDPNSNLLGVPPAYWLYLKRYKPLDIIKTINKPILVIQGKRDYQVVEEEYNNWQNALKDNQQAKFYLYPKLNHLFLEGEGQSMPEEYEIPSNIPVNVINDISKWILGN